MYDSQTLTGGAVASVDTLGTGRILVDDDDRAFGGFTVDALDPDLFLDRAPDIVLHTQKRHRVTRRPSPLLRGAANDHRRSASRKPKIELVLYTSAASEKSVRAIRAVQAVLQRYDSGEYSLTIHDLAATPMKGEEDGVVFTPTLVKRGPGPRTWIVGNLDEPDLLVDLLEVSGVGRRTE